MRKTRSYETYRCVLDEMREISKFLQNLSNSFGPHGDKHLGLGKLYENEEAFVGGVDKTFFKERNLVDFRDIRVDDVIAEEGRDYLVNHVVEFCKENNDGDLQTLLIGCALNVYYTSGLFDRCGILPVSLFDDVLFDEHTKNYVSLIEKQILARVISLFSSLRENGLFSDEMIDEYMSAYEKCGDTANKDQCLNKVIECIAPKALAAQSFVKAVLKDYDVLNQMINLDPEELIKEMYNINESYQFANIMMLIDAVQEFCLRKGENTSFLEYIDKCDNYLIKVAFGVKNEGWDLIFGLGMPYITCVDWKTFCKPLIDSDNTYTIKKSLEGSLSVPRVIPVDINIMKYSLSLASECSKSENEKQKALDDKKLIINRFSHTYMGMRATSLYNIATELIKQDEKKFRDYGRKLLYEYSIKKNLSKDVEMLKLRFEDRIDELNDKISGSIFQEGCQDGVGMRKLISDALTRCMITLVHDGKAKKVREGFKDFDLIEIRNDFEGNVLLSETPNIIDWFRNNVFDLSFKLSSGWNRICFEDDSYAALLLVDIITELIINIFKYADKSDSIVIELTENDECMIIKTQNIIRSEICADLEGGYGLVSEGDAIEVLNEINGYNKHAVEYDIEENLFKVNVSIVRSVFKL